METGMVRNSEGKNAEGQMSLGWKMFEETRPTRVVYSKLEFLATVVC